MWQKISKILILAILSAGFFILGWYGSTNFTSTMNVKIDSFETARLKTDGTKLKILTSTYLNTTNFIFLDERGKTASTLSVSNVNIETPYYKIINGHTHDWLVVTKIKNSGTGMISRIDEWYILGWFGNMKMVLSYDSQGDNVFHDGSNNKYWNTDIVNDKYLDDSAVDIKTTEKDCTTTENGDDKSCSEKLKTAHYVWDNDNEELVLKK